MYNYCYYKGGDYNISNNYIHDMMGTTTQYGIYHYAYYGSGSGDMRIDKNRIIMLNLPTTGYGAYIYGYYATITGAYSASDNYIQLEKSTTGANAYCYGLYSFANYYLTSFKQANIDRNTVRMQTYAGYGIYAYIYYNSNFTARGSISNNIVDFSASYYVYAIYAYCYGNNQPIDMSYNTVIGRNLSSTSSSGYKYLIYAYYVDGAIHNNNLLSMDNGGTNFGLYDYYCTGSFSNNNIWDANTGASFTFGARNGTNVSDFNDYKTQFNDKNGKNLNPLLGNITTGDYKPTSFNFVNLGVPVKGITNDNANVTRSATPDIGALEYYIDVAFSNFVITKSTVCGGYKENFTVTITNNNLIDIQDVPVAFTINGVRKLSEVVNATIKAGKTIDYTFTTPAEFNFPGVNTAMVFLDGTDDNTSNNAITKKITVTNSPYGGEIVEGATFPGYFRQGGSGGLTANPDVTIPDLEIAYDINNPTNHPTSTYGSAWDMKGVYMTSGGMAITTGVSYTAPSGSTLGKVTFKPSTALMDSMVYIGVTATNKTTLCDSTFGRWVYVPHAPAVDFSFKPACDGEVIEFKNLSTLAKGIMLYDWQFNDPKNNDDATDVGDPVFKYSTYGTYSTDLNVKLAAYPKFIFTKTIPVTVTPVPTIDFKVYNACEKLPVVIVNDTKLPAGVVGTISYTWNYGGAGSGDPVSTKSPKYIYTKAGGYQVTLTAVSNGCSSTVTKNANQFALPKAAFTKTGTCNLEEIDFTNNTSISIGKSGFEWYADGAKFSTLQQPTHIFQTPGAKTVKLMAISEFGCKDSASVTFNLAESPKADFTYSDPCNLTAVKFNRTGSIPTGVNSIYEWDFSGENSSTNQNPSHLFNTLGFKDVTLIVRSANGCADQTTKSFPVKLQSKASFSTDDVCEGQEVAFTNSSNVAAGNLAYEWRFGDGNNSFKTSPKHSYNINGITKTYSVTLVANVPGGCSDSITSPVTVNAASSAAFTVKVEGRNALFTQTTTDATNAYNWRFGDGSSAKTVNPTYSYSNSEDVGSYKACLGIINSAGCLSETCNNVNINLVSVNNINTNGLTVYPNPSTGAIKVSLDKVIGQVDMKVFNLLGELVNTNSTELNTGNYNINLGHLANGVYMLQVSNGNTTATQRITISH
jgi:PKD repeat protein